MSVPDPVTTGVVVATVLGVANQTQNFIAAASGHPGESIGTILGNLGRRRIQNAEVVGNKAGLTLLNLGVQPKEVPLNILYPLLEGASLQEDPSLQDLWANLLANAADPRQERPVLPSFQDALKNLTSKDAAFLTAVYRSAEDTADRPVPGTYPIPEISMRRGDLVKAFVAAGLSRMPKLYPLTLKEMNDSKSDYEADMADFRFTLGVAIRHGILAEKSVPAPINTKAIEKTLMSSTKMGVTTPLPVGVEVSYLFTEFGAAFVRACQQPKS